MQMIECLRNFFTRGLEFYSSLLSYFPIFFQKNKFSNFKIKIFKYDSFTKSIFQN
jgi:hypothetical protein